MYESAFDNLGSIYSKDNSNNESIFDSALKPDYLK